jgi:hypothetical protein
MLISVIDCDDISILKMLDVIKTDGLDRNAIASECLRLLMAVQKAKSLEDSLENNSILLPLSLKYKKSGINVVAQYLVEAITHMRGGVVDDAVLQMNLLRASEYIKNKRAEAMAKKSVQ